METLSRKVAELYRADIVALDATDVPVMLVEVRAKQEESAFGQERLTRYLQEAVSVPYAMLVTLRDIRIFEWKSQTLALLLTASTADALSFYDSEFSEKNIYHDYLTTLVETWLRDVAYHWKSMTPPLFEELSRLGLAEKLNEGTTRQEQAL